MSDRVKALTVVLERDYRDDDLEDIVKAVSMVKGVLEVAPVLANPSDFIQRTRLRAELSEKLFNVLMEKQT